MRSATTLSAVLIGTALLTAGCGGTPDPAVTVTQAAPTVTVEATPSDSVPAESPEEADEAASSTDEAAEPQAATFPMPKLVGKNLQLAQDILQSKDSYVLDQQDAAGLDRIQVMDSNWKVCSQDPKAGKKTSVDDVITLASVKLDEDCP